MSNYRSTEARELAQERRTADRERTIERHAARVQKYATVRVFGGVK